MPLSYRPMQANDVPAALVVRTSTIENAITVKRMKEDYGITPQSIADALTLDAKGWLCEDGDKVVGFSMGNGTTGEVEVVAVLPEYEGRNIGKTVLAYVRDWLFSLGHSEIWLLADPAPDIRASGFYQKLGWKAPGIMRGRNQMLTLQKPGRA